MKILIDNAIVTGDLGGPSIVSAFCDMVKEKAPDAVIDLLTEKVTDEEKEYLSFLGIGYLEVGSYFSISNARSIFKSIRNIKNNVSFKTYNSVERITAALLEYDAIVDMGGICFTDDIPFKNWGQALLSKRKWIVCKKMGIKVILYTTAIGPFRTKKNVTSFKMYLNHFCDFAIMRDEESERLYRKYCKNNSYCVAPDTAFVMRAIRPDKTIVERSHVEDGVIGISLSFQLQKKTENYFEEMRKVCTELLNRSYKLLLIANECSGHEGSDDWFVVQKMKDTLNSENVFAVNSFEMNGNNLKWVIGKCDAVISSRYHTLIAAISSGTPCLALSWHHKYKEALFLVGQDQYIVENKNFHKEEIINLFEDLYTNLEENKRKISDKVQLIKDTVIEANSQVIDTVMKQK